MKAHTQTFKENLITLGKEINAKVIYTIDGVETELDGDTLGSVTPHYEGNILKSVMKQVDIISDIDIPLNTEINVQFGMKYGVQNYEYINFGNYIVYSSEKQEDTNNYKIIAYDKMLYAMKDYEQLFEVNLYDKNTENYTQHRYLDTNGVEQTSDNWGVYYIQIKPNQSYTISNCQTNGGVNFCWFDSDRTFISRIGQKQNYTNIISPNNASYIGLSLVWNTSISAYDSNFILQEGSQATEVYPKTIKEYIEKLCSKIGLEFANSNEIFANYDKQITQELYANLGYTYRDVLDELAQVTASTICINKDDQLEIRYLNESVNESEEVEGTNLTLTDSESAKINGVVVEGNTTQDGTPTPSSPIPIENVTGLQDIQVCGKNFFGTALKTANSGTSIYTIITDTSDKLEIQGVSSYYSGIYKKYRLQPNTTYTISLRYSEKGSNTGNYVYYKLGNECEQIKISNANGSKTVGTTTTFLSFTTDSTGLVAILFTCNWGTNTGYIVYNDIQIEKGSSASTYEPYKGNTYEINLGKNLYNPSYRNSSQNIYAVNCTATEENGVFTLTATGNDMYMWQVVSSGNSYNANNQGQLYSFDSDTYTITTTNTDIKANYITFYDENKISLGFISFGGVGYTKTFTRSDSNVPANAKYFSLRFGYNLATIGTSYSFSVQLEKGSATSYAPYFTPIELNKISTYKDLIFKGKGVNLYNKDTAETGTISQSDGETISTNTSILHTLYIEVEPNTSYMSSCDVSGLAIRIFKYDKDKTYLGTELLPFPYTIPSNVYYLRLQFNISFDVNLQFEKGSSKTLYEPYNYTGWLLRKEIGKVVLNGSENWQWRNDISTSDGYYTFRNNDYTAGQFNNNTIGYSNYFELVTSGTAQKNNIRLIDTIHYGTTICIDGNIAQTSSALKTWLQSHNTSVYFIKKTPTTTEITNDNYPELLSQLKALDKAKTYEGTTNITSSFPIKFSYATDYETINEDYIKNTRASFGEKYGPINSIVLSRSADSDNIYIQDEESIEENGLCEVKIKDNQILNDNNRNEFLDDLLEYLDGIEYYTNDYESIGITYLDLCDKYKVQIGDTKYDCIMFNDEVDIHDGLNEIIYTNKPKEEVTDYKKATTTDKLQRQTNLIVDKQNQRIEAIVSDSEDSFSQINVELGRISSQVQGYDVTIDELGNEIQTLRSSYTEQTPTMISDWFDTNLKSIVDDLQTTTSGNDEEIRKIKAYIRRGVINDPQSPYYNQAYIELGDETNQTTLRILQNRIQFLTNGQETAFISNNQLYINESTILTKEKVGHWVTTEDEDGLLNTYWED